jgi:hypothetical protein
VEIDMQKIYRLALLVFLALCSLALTASSQEEVALTVYVHEGDLNGTMLSGVQVVGKDATGNEFAGMTDNIGSVVINGPPGTWQFSLSKDGYESLDLTYDVAETEEAAAYLEKTAASEDAVALTVYVHEGDLNGTLLSDVVILGVDAAGNEFSSVTDFSGVAVVYGQPGTWQFAFSKDGYEPIDLDYDVAETDAAAAYLVKND